MKKLILFLLLALIQTELTAQTNLEKLVLKELNTYRKLNKLKPVAYSDSITRASKHHTLWMSMVGFTKINEMMLSDPALDSDSHYESVNVPDFNELRTPEDRGNFYGILNDISSYWEICNMTKADAGNYFVASQVTDDILAKNIISKFSKSPDHDQAMKLDAIARVGISVIVKNELINGQSYRIAYTTIYFVEK
jgi:hypothetical protein